MIFDSTISGSINQTFLIEILSISTVPLMPSTLPGDPPGKRFAGLVERKVRWGLTPKGVVLLLASGLLSLIAVCAGVYPFLAVTDPVPSSTIVVEGWISVSGARKAAELLRSGNYSAILVGGGPIDGTGELDPEVGTYASQGLSRLRHAGAPSSLTVAVPSPRRERDRTYTEALTIKNWLTQHQPCIRSFNILTEGTHARRSRILFEKAFGADVQIGIISLSPADYPAARWWRYSEGVKEVISETAAYLYARLFFWPD